MADHSFDGSIHFSCMDWRSVDLLMSVGEQVYDEIKNICVWVKNSPGMGSLYRSQQEFVVVLKKGKTLQKFASVHANVHNLFASERHLVDRQTYKERRSAALAEWQILAA